MKFGRIKSGFATLVLVFGILNFTLANISDPQEVISRLQTIEQILGELNIKLKETVNKVEQTIETQSKAIFYKLDELEEKLETKFENLFENQLEIVQIVSSTQTHTNFKFEEIVENMNRGIKSAFKENSNAQECNSTNQPNVNLLKTKVNQIQEVQRNHNLTGKQNQIELPMKINFTEGILEENTINEKPQNLEPLIFQTLSTLSTNNYNFFNKTDASLLDMNQNIEKFEQNLDKKFQLFYQKVDQLEKAPIFTIGEELNNLLSTSNYSNFIEAFAKITGFADSLKNNQMVLHKQISDLQIENKKEIGLQTNNITFQLIQLTYDVGGVPGKFLEFPRVGEWAVIQRRGVNQDKPRISFEKTFQEYEEWFGDYNGDFWIGLKNIHALTSAGYTELKIVLTDWDGEQKIATYKNFQIGNKYDNYRLTVGQYSGTAGDGLEYHNGSQFSTSDKDNDNRASTSCSHQFGRGGWWYHDCMRANLNGKYKTQNEIKTTQGIFWSKWKIDYSFKSSEMMVKIQ